MRQDAQSRIFLSFSFSNRIHSWHVIIGKGGRCKNRAFRIRVRQQIELAKRWLLARQKERERDGSVDKKRNRPSRFTWQNLVASRSLCAPKRLRRMIHYSCAYVALSPRNLRADRARTLSARGNPNHRWNLHSAYRANYERHTIVSQLLHSIDIKDVLTIQ